MTDQTPETDPALDGATLSAALGGTPTDPAAGSDIVKRVLSLEYVMNHARLEQREVPLCLRGDLSGEFARLQEELGDLVDVDGKALAEGDGDAALGEQARATEIGDRLRELSRLMRDDTFFVTLRALPQDQFEDFELRHRGKPGAPVKDPKAWADQLISACALAPQMNVEQVKQLRSKLNHAQIDALVRAAYSACTEGGIDVPKLPGFLPNQQPQE